jgi:hypothetical protein
MERRNEPLAQNLALDLSRSNGGSLNGTQYLRSSRSNPKSWNSWLAENFALKLAYSKSRNSRFPKDFTLDLSCSKTIKVASPQYLRTERSDPNRRNSYLTEDFALNLSG